jgi:hypothetical protein
MWRWRWLRTVGQADSCNCQPASIGSLKSFAKGLGPKTDNAYTAHMSLRFDLGQAGCAVRTGSCAMQLLHCGGTTQLPASTQYRLVDVHTKEDPSLRDQKSGTSEAAADESHLQGWGAACSRTIS